MSVLLKCCYRNASLSKSSLVGAIFCASIVALFYLYTDKLSDKTLNSSVQSTHTGYVYKHGKPTCADTLMRKHRNSTTLSPKNCHVIEKWEDRVKQTTFTIIILSHDRVKVLTDTVNHYARMRNVSLIYVLWSNEKVAPPTIASNEDWYSKLIIHHLEANNLTLRFKSRQEITTDGIFSVDDDIRVSENDMVAAFKVWKSYPDSLVGFFPRKIALKNGHYQYQLTEQAGYSMILTGAAFYNRKYMIIYFNTLPAGILKLIDKWRNCEDIAMNYLVSCLVGCPSAIYVQPSEKVIHTSFHISGGKTIVEGLSGRPHHPKQRSECVDVFARFYTNMPLTPVDSVVKAATLL